MSDIKLLRDHVDGLEKALREERNIEARFIKASGLDEQAEKDAAEAERAREKVAEIKVNLSELLQKRNAAVASTAKALSEAGSAMLPEGELSMIVSEDGAVSIGWKRPDDGVVVPYAGLSGGQKVLVDAALCYALSDASASKNRVIIMEAAELDSGRLNMLLSHLVKTNPSAQVVVNTCHLPNGVVPDGWKVVEV